MNEEMLIDENKVYETLTSFKKEIDKMNLLFSEIENDNKEAKLKWEGKASDYVLSSFTYFQQLFDEINEKNKKYINFIITIINKYKEENTSQIDVMENNIDSFSMNNSRI